jgi:hypothetical protein
MQSKKDRDDRGAGESSGEEGYDAAVLPLQFPYSYPYACIDCLTPCESLYKQYSTPSSVKLTRCSNAACQRDVDPYMEREWFLVALDLILHRRGAYRHLYLHDRMILQRSRRSGDGSGNDNDSTMYFVLPWDTESSPTIRESGNNPQREKNDSTGFASQNNIFWQGLQSILLASVLEASDLWDPSFFPASKIMSQIFVEVLCSVLPCFMGQVGVMLTSWMICGSLLSLAVGHESQSKANVGRIVNLSFFAQIFLALTVPTIMMSIILGIALVWEQEEGDEKREPSFSTNGVSFPNLESLQSVRTIATLLTASQQFLGLFCILQRRFVMMRFYQWIWTRSGEDASIKEDMQGMIDINFWVHDYFSKENGSTNRRETEGSVPALSRPYTFICGNLHCIGIGFVCCAALGSGWLVQSWLSGEVSNLLLGQKGMFP